MSQNDNNLELLLEVLGIEGFDRLCSFCAGMQFYIPKNLNKKACIKKDIFNLKKQGATTSQIRKALSSKYELKSSQTARYLKNY